MKKCLIAAIRLGTAPGCAADAEVKYDLWTTQSDHGAVIAVAAQGDDKPYTAASGQSADGLDVLEAEDAKELLLDLKAKLDSHDLERVLSNHGATDIGSVKKRVKLIEQEIQAKAEPEDDGLARGSGHEEVVASENTTVEKVGSDASSKEKLVAELDRNLKAPAASGERTTVIQTSEDGVSEKLTHVSGVDAKTARDFIDAADGLSDEEKAAMKKALAL